MQKFTNFWVRYYKSINYENRYQMFENEKKEVKNGAHEYTCVYFFWVTIC